MPAEEANAPSIMAKRGCSLRPTKLKTPDTIANTDSTAPFTSWLDQAPNAT
jgi:hypothetical protein